MNPNCSFLMARRLAGAALLGGLLIFAAGCGRHNGIVGKWQGRVPFGTMTLPMTIEFKPDGTDTKTFKALTGTTVLSDTYVIKDGSLCMTPTSMTIDGKMRLLPPLLASPQTFTIKSVNADTLSLTMAGQAQTCVLTRVKP